MNGADVVRAAGITYRQLDYWTRRGYIRPEGAAAGGKTDILGPYALDQIRAAAEDGTDPAVLAKQWRTSVKAVRRILAGAYDVATPGSGNSRDYTEAECVVAERMGRLARAGVAVPDAAVLARYPDMVQEPVPGVFIVVTATRPDGISVVRPAAAALPDEPASEGHGDEVGAARARREALNA